MLAARNRQISIAAKGRMSFSGLVSSVMRSVQLCLMRSTSTRGVFSARAWTLQEMFPQTVQTTCARAGESPVGKALKHPWIELSCFNTLVIGIGWRWCLPRIWSTLHPKHHMEVEHGPDSEDCFPLRTGCIPRNHDRFTG